MHKVVDAPVMQMAWRGIWHSFSAIPGLWNPLVLHMTRSSQSLLGGLQRQSGVLFCPQMAYRTQPYRVEKSERVDIAELNDKLVAALRNESAQETVDILKAAEKERVFGALFNANRQLQALTEQKLQKILPADFVYHGNKNLFFILIQFLGNKHSGPVWSAHFVRGCLDQERFPHLAASTHLGFVVNLLKVCNQAQLKLSSKTASDIDSWLNTFLGKRINPKLDKRFTQFLSCAGNAELRFSGSTTEKLIAYMMESMRSNNAATPNDYTTSLATYVWYFKMVKTIPSLHADEFWSLWQDCAVKFVEYFTEQGCSMILNSMADLELTPTSELLKSLLEKMASLEFRESQHVSNSLRSMTFISRAFPETRSLMTNTGVGKKLMMKWFEMLRKMQLNEQDLSNGIWGITELELVPAESVPQVLDVFYKNSLNLIPVSKPQGLSNILLSIGKLHQLHQKFNFDYKYCHGAPTVWWKSYWGQFSKVLNDQSGKEWFTNQSLSNVIAAMSLMGTSPVEYRSIPLTFLLDEFKLRIDQMNDIQISTVILHLGHLNIRDKEILSKAYLRAEDLLYEKKIDERHGRNLATGLTLLGHRIPKKLWEFIASCLENLTTFQVLSVLDVCTIQRCIFEQEQEPSIEIIQKVVKHSMALKEAATGLAELSILQRAIVCFGEEAFSKDHIRFITEKQPMFQRLAQEKMTGYFTKGEKVERDKLMSAILANYHDYLDIKSTWKKVVPEAGCTVKFEVQDRKTTQKFAIQPDGFHNSYYDSEGNRTNELPAKTETNSKLLEKAGYRVFRCDGDELKNNPALVGKKLREFFEKHGVF